MTLNLYKIDAYSSHSVLTLSERGFKRLDSYRSQGDHYVHLKVRVPLNLTQEQVSPIITAFLPLNFFWVEIEIPLGMPFSLHWTCLVLRLQELN